MGIYFNPTNESFAKDIRSEIYIDKTGLLEHLNKALGTAQNCISVSHARRFGKSQAAGMIDAYYSRGSDSRNLFRGFEISEKQDFTEHLNKYNVIHLDISSFTDFYRDNLIEKIQESIYRELKEVYPDIVSLDYPFGMVLMDVYQKSGIPFVIILDEWDCVIRKFADRTELVHDYLQFLHAIFKSEESKKFLALAYITGILPVKKIKDESALNNFREYTMISSKKLTPYFGFTETEVIDLCEKYHMDFSSVKEWYDGYQISGFSMYNPNSVCLSMEEHSLESYWKNTSSFETINDLITLDMEGLKESVMKMIEGGRSPVNVNKFQNDLSMINTKDDALTALIHLGYLGYDADMEEAFIPDFEVALAFQSALSDGKWENIAKTISRCQELLMATIRKEEDKVAELVGLAHDTYSSLLKYNDENSLSCAITMAYFTAPAYYNVVRELPSGKGFADIAMIPRGDAVGKPAIIIELKWNEDADTAIRQIKERRYAGSLDGFGDEILLAGISYNKNSSDKKHQCRIESFRL